MRKYTAVLLCVLLLFILAACNEASESQTESPVDSSQEETSQSDEVEDNGEVPEFAKAIDEIRAQDNIESFPAVAQAFSLEDEGYRLLLHKTETEEDEDMRIGFYLSEEEMSEVIIYSIDHATGTLVQVYFDDISSSITSYLIGTNYYYHIDDKLIMIVPDSNLYDNDTE